MKRSRQVATLLMILSLTICLTGCGGSSDAVAPQADEAEVEETQQTTEAEAPEDTQAPSEPRSTEGLRIASLEGVVNDDVATVEGEWGVESYGSVDALAKAFIAGDIDMAVVPPDSAAALYNATAGSLMAIDAVALPGESARSTTVVSMVLFSEDPELVVAYVARHQELVSSTLGSDCFLVGSPMQRELVSVISDAYVESPTLVGGELPPDNFYFLG